MLLAARAMVTAFIARPNRDLFFLGDTFLPGCDLTGDLFIGDRRGDLEGDLFTGDLRGDSMMGDILEKSLLVRRTGLLLLGAPLFMFVRRARAMLYIVSSSMPGSLRRLSAILEKPGRT